MKLLGLKDKLYVINTNFVPLFLDPNYRNWHPSSASESQRIFHARLIKKQGICPLPYVGLFKNHARFQDQFIISDVGDDYRPFPIQGGRMRDGNSLEDGLSMILHGCPVSAPLHVLVEFSEQPLYHDTIDYFSTLFEIVKRKDTSGFGWWGWPFREL